MDFVHDQLATGRKIRVLTVVDTFSRYVPVLDPRFSYRASDGWLAIVGHSRRDLRHYVASTPSEASPNFGC
ncbi:protein of unknown function [Magnetospirillum gryphiswaldense MSR-1 v2]|uniref:Uncharacterized protein n=1 Tax=Magnetospirillum gryphiswaldense (strain DSM 6361 / JCM 21280 / NBRC 15271 / MSR-1) TaxID=431944 RepID=V6F0S7_MAGGM|nr:protein of unknown function [Magnetospirillum gryphiswaldense MSR-1 v2]